jgi:DNA-binding beta-propeller fold protein YncE
MGTSVLLRLARRRTVGRLAAIFALTLLAPPLAGAGPFVTFESGPVRPMAMSPDGLHLYAVNIPDNRLEIFDVGDSGISHIASVPVGMEPVAVAAHGDDEAWVVNNLSDSVSIVRLSQVSPPHVTQTLLVGDEPKDILFAGPGGNRAFITTANRHLPRDPSNSERNADVWVFDAQNLGDSQAGGTPLAVVNLFADVPRALAVSPDGGTVYAAVFNSGNQTTVVGGDDVHGDLPPPLTNFEGAPAPEVGLILKYNGVDWVDAAGRPWTQFQTFSMPDWDVFAIDANAATPQQSAVYSGVGTVLFNMVTNPDSGNIYVSNLDANNSVRFEGPGVFGGSTVRGHIAESRITVIDGDGVHPRHLNKHINYDVFPGTPDENAKSLAFPLQMVLNARGSTLYTVAFGSSKVGIYDVAALEDDTFVPNESDQIEVSGGGPCGLVLDEGRNRLYVLTRFDDSIVTVDLSSRSEKSRVSLYNPEPRSVVTGRRFLYDASFTSSHGDSACASCHIFGDNDGLAWDLGNPDDVVKANPNPIIANPGGMDTSFHPMKGPMTTQSLRGLANAGPMHWRGDRTGGSLPDGNPLSEREAFEAFNVAFEGLLGRTAPLSDRDMTDFTEFALQLTYPPNPIRNLDNSLTAQQQRGRFFFFNFPSEVTLQSTCETCHLLQVQFGFFGTAGISAIAPGFEFALKIPHLRNLYTKDGITTQVGPATGPQIRGFGFLHDGSADTIFEFLHQTRFRFPGGDDQRRDVISFLLAFDSNLAPIAGHQVTLTASNFASARETVNLLVTRSQVTRPRPECDLIVKGNSNGLDRGWLRMSDALYHSDRTAEAPLSGPAILALALKPNQQLTFTCVPPGSGVRMALDRDEDGYYDRDELDAGSDPADPRSIPQGLALASRGSK